MSKTRKIDVLGNSIAIVRDEVDFISLTDMVRAKDGDFFRTCQRFAPRLKGDWPCPTHEFC